MGGLGARKPLKNRLSMHIRCMFVYLKNKCCWRRKDAQGKIANGAIFVNGVGMGKRSFLVLSMRTMVPPVLGGQYQCKANQQENTESFHEVKLSI